MRLQRMGINHSRHGVCGVVEAVDKLKSKSHQQGNPQQKIGQERFRMNVRKIAQQAGAGVENSNQQHGAKNQHAEFARGAGEFLVEYARGGGSHDFLSLFWDESAC